MYIFPKKSRTRLKMKTFSRNVDMHKAKKKNIQQHSKIFDEYLKLWSE